MTDVDRLNRTLNQLDDDLRAGTLARDEYRRRRRRLLLEFEMPAPTVQSQDQTIEHRQADTLVVDEPGPPKKKWVPVLAMTAVVVLAVALGAAFLPRAGKAPPAAAPLATATAPQSGVALPQTVAKDFMNSGWSDSDIGEFLRRWSTVAPEARRAARDDAGLWLLRSETDRRLREARDAQAVDPTPAAQSRVEQLSRLQSALHAD